MEDRQVTDLCHICYDLQGQLCSILTGLFSEELNINEFVQLVDETDYNKLTWNFVVHEIGDEYKNIQSFEHSIW